MPRSKALALDLSDAADLDVESDREGVHDGDADAVQSARDLVGVLVEFSAGVQGRHDDFRGRALLRRVHVGRDAAAVVDDGDAAVVVDHDLDLRAVAGQGLVDRVVDDLVDQVMEAIGTGRPDVHRRPLSDRFEAFEDLDGTGVVGHRETFFPGSSRAFVRGPGCSTTRC